MIDKYLNYIQEGYIFSDKTISIDLDKFESGEINKLIIMGVSGAGKSTLANYLAKKYNCEVNELDNCCKSILNPEEYREYLDGDNPVKRDKLFKRFHNECFKPSLLTNKKEIIEGAIYQSYALYPETRSFINKYPVIIIGTSALKAVWLRTQRTHRNHATKGKEVTIKNAADRYKRGLVLNLKYLQKYINLFKKERIKAGGNVESFKIPKLKETT